MSTQINVHNFLTLAETMSCCAETAEMEANLTVGTVLSIPPRQSEPPQRIHVHDVVQWKQWAFYALCREAGRRRVGWRDAHLWDDLAEAACIGRRTSLVRHIDPSDRRLFRKDVVTRIERALRTWDGQDINEKTYRRRLRHLRRQNNRYRLKDALADAPFDPLELDVMHNADVDYFTNIILSETDAACRVRYFHALDSLIALYNHTTEKFARQWNPELRKQRVRRRVRRPSVKPNQ